MWNEQNWTLVSLPTTSNRAEWDEGLRTVRQFNDLLRVLPPIPKAAIGQAPTRRNGAPGRPIAPQPEVQQPGHVPPGRAQEPTRQQPTAEPGRRPPQTRAPRPGPRSYQQ
jgi:hypothetical protein